MERTGTLGVDHYMALPYRKFVEERNDELFVCVEELGIVGRGSDVAQAYQAAAQVVAVTATLFNTLLNATAR